MLRAVCAILALISPISTSRHSLKASQSLFDTAYKGLTYSAISWYDRNPSGRISSRMSKVSFLIVT